MASASLRAVGSAFVASEHIYPTTAFGAVLYPSCEAEEYMRRAMTEDLQTLTTELAEARAQACAGQDSFMLPQQADSLSVGASADIGHRREFQYRLSTQEKVEFAGQFFTSEVMGCESCYDTEEAMSTEETGLFHSHETSVEAYDDTKETTSAYCDFADDRGREMPDPYLAKIPEFKRISLLARYPDASEKAVVAIWMDDSTEHETPRKIHRQNYTASDESSTSLTRYRCPIIVNGSQCLASSSTPRYRRVHMDRHYRGRFICPGVCDDPWFSTKEDLYQHLKHHSDCSDYHNPNVDYRICEQPRWLAHYPAFKAMQSLPKDDPLSKRRTRRVKKSLP